MNTFYYNRQTNFFILLECRTLKESNILCNTYSFSQLFDADLPAYPESIVIIVISHQIIKNNDRDF